MSLQRNANPAMASLWSSAHSSQAHQQPVLLNAIPTAIAVTQQLALHQSTTLRCTPAQDIRHAREAGWGALAVCWNKLVLHGVKTSATRIKRSELKISSIGWLPGFTNRHGYRHREAIEEGQRMLKMAKYLGAESVTVLAGPQNSHIRPHAKRLVVEGLKALSDVAADFGVKLALQPMHPVLSRERSFVGTLDEALTILDKVRHPSVGLAFNTFHLATEVNLLTQIRELTPRIVNVVLSDAAAQPTSDEDQQLPGQGVLPLSAIVKELTASGYRGWYEVEVWSRQLWRTSPAVVAYHCSQAASRLWQSDSHLVASGVGK